MPQNKNISEILENRAAAQGERPAFIFLSHGETGVSEERLTYAGLDTRARAIGAALEAAGAGGGRVALLLPPGPEFVASFFGCLYAGAVAVPALPPRRRGADPRLAAICRDARPRVVLAAEAQLPALESAAAEIPELAAALRIAPGGVEGGDGWQRLEVGPEALAFLQYTSGSTSTPKGVMVSHGNLLHNEELIRQAFGQSPESVVLGWLPLYHDMGLIGTVLQPLFTGAVCYLMTPGAFLQRPVRWLEAISRYRATTSGGPNFAYELCVRKIGEAEREGLDLSSWRVAFNGAEPVRAGTLARFAEAFAPCGFRASAFRPCYGLAEATLLVSSWQGEEAPRVRALDAAALERHEAAGAGAMEDAGEAGRSRGLVSCGVGMQTVLAVDPETGMPCPPARVGEIWVAGPSVAQGYWQRPEETAATFGAHLADGGGPFLRTGDLGFVCAGELFLTGRLKDLVILRGRNHYPQDLELTAEQSHADLRTGGGAAFAVDLDGEERLVIVHEVDRHARLGLEGERTEEIAAAVRRAVAEEHEVSVAEVVLIRPETLPRTSSGKVRRRACRDLYLEGGLRTIGASRLSQAATDVEPGSEAAVGSPDWLRREFAAAARVDPGQVDPDLPLAAAGLDSLAAVELKQAVEEGTGIDLPLAELLEGMTLRELEARVALTPSVPLSRTAAPRPGRGGSPLLAETAGSPPDRLDRIPLSRLGREARGEGHGAAQEDFDAATGEHPLSWNQRSLWFLNRLAPESSAYNIAGAARLSPVSREALGRALQALMDRHPMLRATFAATPGGPVQRVVEKAEVAFEVLDAGGWSDAEVQARLEAEAHRPFDLAAGPLFRTVLLTRGDEAFLALAVHHIAADFWSMAVLARELGALVAGEALLPPASLYTDFTRRQERRLASPAGERLWEHWRNRLAGTPRLDLPTDRPRRADVAPRGGARTLAPSPERAEAVQRLAAAHGTTPFVALLAAWQAALARWSGQEEFLAGAPMAGRSAREWGEVVGYFVNLVPIRTDLSGDLAVPEHLARARRTVLDALSHQEFPFALLAERLEPERDPSRPPLVAAMLTYEKAPAPELAALAAFAVGEPGVRLDLGGLVLESLPLAPPAAQLDLSLTAAEWSAGLAVSLLWDAELFDEATAGRMLGHLDRLLAGMAASAAGQRVVELPLLAPEERDQLLLSWSGAESTAVGAGCLHELFEAQAARTPELTALIAGTERLTYDDLNRRANRLAHHLRRLGAGPEERVGVLLGRSGELVAALLGILKAGAAYVPLDPAYPEEWLAFAADDARITLLLTEERYVGRLPGRREIVLGTESRGEALSKESEENPAPLAGPGNLAYVMYTSGSTGRPKGVALAHRSPVERMHWAGAAFSAEELAGVLAATSICFDLSVFEIFAPLSWGGTVILADNALALPGLPARDEVTLVNTVPSAMTELAGGELPPSLRTVCLAGEALPLQLSERIYRHAQVERVVNLYGPTEDATYSTGTPVERGVARVTIGRPLPGTRAYVLDRHLQPVPGGVPGELLLAGAGGARGYLGRPDLTAEKFVPDPFGTEPGGRLYSTGDLARWLATGALEHLGRLDHQVKVRGFRIELGEIEAALLAHPGVRQAVVTVREGAGGKALVAYVAGEEPGSGAPPAASGAASRPARAEERTEIAPKGQVAHPANHPDLPLREAPAPTAADLREHLSRLLPAHMIPAFFVALPALPLTLNGKVDRKALPAPEGGAEEGWIAPRTPVEEVLAGIWAELLGLERVGVTDHFFDRGGHSLLATRVMSRLSAAFGVELPVRELFEAPTVAGLAARVEAARRSGAAPAVPPLLPALPAPRQEAPPLSFAQQRLWFIDQLEPGSPLYNMPGALRAAGPLDGAVLARCLGEIVRRHEVLRTVFAASDGVPVQVILPGGALTPSVPLSRNGRGGSPPPEAAPDSRQDRLDRVPLSRLGRGARGEGFPLPLVDLGGLPDEARETLALALLREEAIRPFDLTRGPLLRGLLLRLAERDHLIALTLHHIAGDGWSLGILAREIAALYPALAAGRPSPLPELPIQYADFAMWQRSWLDGPVLEGEIDFWRGQLAGLPPVLELPTDRPRPAVQSYRGRTRPVRLPAALARLAETLARSEGATLFMVLLAAFQAVLARISGQEDLAVGTPVAGRNRVETEGLIGLFVNTLVLRGDLAGAPTFRELLGRVRERALAAYLHQDVPFEKLVDELAPERSLAQTPLFQVMFELQNAPAVSLEIEDLRLRPIESVGTLAKFDLTFALEERDGGLAGTIEHATDLFDATTIDRLTGRFERLLAAAAGAPDLALFDLPLTSEAESFQLLSEWNDTRVEGLSGGCLHGEVAAQAVRTPAAVAVELGGERWTYRRLVGSARLLARHLRELGVGPDTVVGLSAERSPATVVGMLAVLEAGGAWLPLDPALPAERLAFVLDDAGARVLLAQDALLERLPTESRSVVLLDGRWDAGEDMGQPLAVPVEPGNLAYVIYTSGSTGRPKGVMVTHRGICNRLRWARQAYRLDGRDAFLHKTSPGFDVAVWECFGALSSGARLVLAEPGRQADGAYLVRAIREHGVTFVDFVPSMLAAFVAEEGVESCGSLRQVITGGETLTPELRDRVLARLPVPLDNTYGPTEITIDTTRQVCAPGQEQDPHRVPIGRPIANSRLYVVDRELRPLPVGVTGELLVGGAGVARGYLGRPDLTAERFVPDPYGAEPGERLYRTGDLVAWLPDGALDFLGRLDHQVKVRGFRIELGEIETALTALPGVHEAVVVAREDGGGGQPRLVAYVVASSGTALEGLPVREAGQVVSVSDLRQALHERLPDYMVPAAFVTLPALPLTANGKVDRKALPAPEKPGARECYAAPRTREEEILAGVWAQVLSLPRVGVDDNFFELGGDSILSVQIVTRARQAGLGFTVRQIFEHQTVAELARHAVTEAAAVQAEQGPVTGEVPLTPIQRWFFAERFADPHHFNQALVLEAREPLAPAALQSSLAAVVAHHDALRMRFVFQGGGWRQENGPVGSRAPFCQIDLGALPGPRAEETFEHAAAALEASFDLSVGPLTRLCLFTGSGQPDRLLWATHHLVVDGVSWRVLVEDLEGAYHQAARWQRPSLPPKTTSFQEWSRRLAGHAGSETPARELDFWRETARVSIPRLPVDFPDGGNLVGDEASISFELSREETTELLQGLPPVYHSRIDDALLSALARALSGWTGSPRLLVDLEGHGREPLFDDLDVSRTVGWFTTVYPVVLEAGDLGPAEALLSAKELLRAVPGRGLGYGLLRHLNEETGCFLEAAPAAEISFNYLGQVDPTSGGLSFLEPAGTSAGPVQSPRAHRTHLLEVGGRVAEGRLRISLTYGARMHRRETAEHLAAAYAEALRQLIREARGSAELFTPADFPKAALGAPGFGKLAALLAGSVEPLAGLGVPLENVEDIYPLTPLQSGMLFHGLMAPESGVYINQVACTLAPDLDSRLFRQAWERLVRRHGVLRTAFFWEGLDEPRQVVRKGCVLPWRELDWRGLSEEEQGQRFEELRQSDRHTPLVLDEAPLMRFSLVRLERGLRFLWTSHHLLLDGWSLPLLVQELGTVYGALAEGREPALPPAPPFGDYIAWLAGRDAAEAEPFWRGELAGFTAPNALGMGPRVGAGLGGGREGDPSSAGFAEHGLSLSREVTAELQALAARHKATLQTLTLGAWALLVGRYSGAADVVFGSVVSGRPAALPGVERTVGMFVNTLPVRVKVAETAPLATWLQELKERQLARQDFEHTPLADIQRWSEVPAGSPLFETLYVFENYPDVGEGRSGNLGIGDLETFESTNYPLTLALTAGERISLRLTSDRARVDGEAALRLLGHLATLLAGMAESAAGAERPVGALPLLTAAEERQILGEWNDTASPWVEERLLHEVVAAQAARTPSAVAVELGDERWTYRRLVGSARLLGRHLRELGVGPDTIVGLCAERSPAMVLGLLAILEAGGAWLPLDPTLPPDRLAFMVDDSGARVLLLQEHLHERVPAVAGRCFVPLDGRWISDEEMEEVEGAEVTPEQLAYVIYTSGSTGRPKGVMVPHRGVANRLRWAQEVYRLGERDAVLQKASFGFDFSVWECFAPLQAGARLVLAEPGRQGDGPYLVRAIREHQVTFVHFVPSMLAAFLTEEGIEACGSLRQVFSGGEALTPELRDRALARLPAPLDNQYGPTEISIDATQWACAPGQDPHRVPIGRPIANTRIYVVDRELRPLPVGVAGELLVGGAGVTRGYLRRPDLTAERFVPDPFGGDGDRGGGGRLYRTGDLARRLPDGALDFLGRLDHQVKIRGLRIELGEIEAALAALPGVRQAVVMAREDPTAGGAAPARLVAYVVTSSETAPEGRGAHPSTHPDLPLRDAGRVVSVSDLRQALRERLPDYMVPAVFVPLPELPLNASGKVDRKALPAPEPSSSHQGYVAPRTREEEILAGVWAQVLRLPRVGVNDNFFELGGDSILSVQIVARARQAGLLCGVREIFENPTVAGLARHAKVADAAASGTGQAPVVGEVPLTPIQRWFFDQGFADPHHFNQALVLESREPLDPAALDRAVAAVVAHHDALRLRFDFEGVDWKQENAPAEPVAPFHQVDLSGLSGPRRHQAYGRAAAALQAGFDLSAGPLARLCLFTGTDQPARLFWVAHHLVVDGVSWRVLLEDLEEAYRQALGGRLPVLPPKSTSFQEWSRRLTAHAGSEALARELDQWRETARAAVPPLPVDFPEGGNLAEDEASVSFELSAEETTELLQTLPSVYHSRIDDALLSALVRAMAGWTGSPRLRVDLEGHGREPLFDDLDLSRTVGWFTSLYPVVLEGGGLPPGESLVSVKELLRAVPGRGIGYGLLRHLRDTELEAYPPAEVLFNYLGQADATHRESPLFRASTNVPGPSRSPRGHRTHALEVSGMVTAGRLEITLTYGSRLHRRETVERLAAAYAGALRQLIEQSQESEEVFTPSDFPKARLDAKSFGKLAALLADSD